MASTIIFSVIGVVVLVGVAFASLSAVAREVDRQDEKALASVKRAKWHTA